ncbi:putative reverse transcriptase domain, reverse transcriptase zinc-binding domain protein [Tanacetum coccineum]
MVSWIMACVSSTSFSLCINGELHGYFKGKRGLRHDDPMSPYLFTLVMEILTLILKRKLSGNEEFQYHKYYHKQKIVNVCFADDLILFARGDFNSAKVIMESLQEFKEVSGLVPSIPKSTAFFCNVASHVKSSILQMMPFEAEWQRFVTLLSAESRVKTVSYHKLYDILIRNTKMKLSFELRLKTSSTANSTCTYFGCAESGFSVKLQGNYGHVSLRTKETADWKDDTDDESEEQELEAHYCYMAQNHEVTPIQLTIWTESLMMRQCIKGDTILSLFASSDICYDRVWMTRMKC